MAIKICQPMATPVANKIYFRMAICQFSKATHRYSRLQIWPPLHRVFLIWWLPGAFGGLTYATLD